MKKVAGIGVSIYASSSNEINPLRSEVDVLGAYEIQECLTLNLRYKPHHRARDCPKMKHTHNRTLLFGEDQRASVR